MTTSTEWKVIPSDVAILRDLALRVRKAVDSPRNQELRERWYRLDERAAERPLILTELDGGLKMVKPDLTRQCQEEWARGEEWRLWNSLIHFEMIADDSPLEPYINHSWHMHISNYGVDMQQTNPEASGVRGAYHIDPAIKDLEKDFHLLKHRTFAVDREGTMAAMDVLRDVYDGIFQVRLRDNPWWTMGLTQTAIKLIGLEELMLYMYDEPEALHRLMAFLRDDFLALIDWMETEELFSLNNENDYLGSGSRGYTRRLPQPDWKPGDPLRAKDCRTLIESQETVGVGPDLYEEFVFPYENAIAKRFGGIYYGCCEPVHTRWNVLKQMANLQRVSVSPWCDEAFMAQALGNDYVYSRKPNPSMVSTDIFDEEAIRLNLRTTMALTKQHNCPTEIIMKDVHTLNNDPSRLTRWVAIAREVTEEFY